MIQALPLWDATFLTEDEIESFDLDTTAISDDYSYMPEVDFKYPEHPHDSHTSDCCRKIVDYERNINRLLFFPDQQTCDY